MHFRDNIISREYDYLRIIDLLGKEVLYSKYAESIASHLGTEHTVNKVFEYDYEIILKNLRTFDGECARRLGIGDQDFYYIQQAKTNMITFSAHEKLRKHFFDVYGLISNNLALDMKYFPKLLTELKIKL